MKFYEVDHNLPILGKRGMKKYKWMEMFKKLKTLNIFKLKICTWCR
jgi:hypothetical protein